MDKKYNQFVAHIMRNDQPDKEKLISLATLLRKTYNLTVQREAILLFDKDDGHLVTISSWITKLQFHKFIIHVPDLLFFAENKLWIIEIDGWIHNTKTSVVRKDVLRKEHYEAAKLNFEIINEWEVLVGLGIKPNRPANVKEIFSEIEKRMKKIIPKQ